MSIKLRLSLTKSEIFLGILKIEEATETNDQADEETNNSENFGSSSNVILLEQRFGNGTDEEKRLFKVYLVPENDPKIKLNVSAEELVFHIDSVPEVREQASETETVPIQKVESIEDKLSKIKEEFEERLQEYCSKQSNFLQSMVTESVEKLKLLKKIFTMQTQKVSNLEKLKKAVLDRKTEDEDESLDENLKKLKMHFWNVHEIYINIAARLQLSIDATGEELKNSCFSIKKYSAATTAPDCVFYQKLCYSRDLLMKFVSLDKGSKFLKEVFSAFVDVFDLSKEERQKFFDNAKQSFLIK
jgi:hypothetical protein